jgi:peptide methionine sulfoxide reductase MsrA
VVSDHVCTPNATVVGYMGGTGCCPTYSNYTSNNNFSETLRLVYDNVQTNFTDLLNAYWT